MAGPSPIGIQPGQKPDPAAIERGKQQAEQMRQQLEEGRKRAAIREGREVEPSRQTGPGQQSGPSSGVRVQAGPTTTTTRETPEGTETVTSTPYVDLPASEVQRRTYAALQAENRRLQQQGGGTITRQGIEAQRQAALEREIAEKGGVEVRQGVNQAAVAEGYRQLQAYNKAVQDYFFKPVLGSKTAAEVVAAQEAAKARGMPQYTKHYTVHLEDRIGGGPYRYERSPGELTQPEQERIKSPPKPTGDPFRDAYQGLETGARNFLIDIETTGKVAYKGITNLPNYVAAYQGDPRGIGKSLLSAKEISDVVEEGEARTGFDVERDVTGLGVQAGFQYATTGRTDVTTGDLETLGKNVQSNIPFAIGSLGFSALSWLGPGAATKGAKIAAKTVEGARAARSLEAFVKAGKKMEPPVNIDIEKNLVNIGTESDITRYSTGRIQSKGIKMMNREPQLTPKADDLLVPTEQRTGYSQTFVNLEKGGDVPVKALRKTPKPETTVESPTLSANPKDANEPLRGIKQTGTNQIKIEKGADDVAVRGEEVFEKAEVIPGRDPVFLKVPKFEKTVATEDFFTYGQLRKLGSTEEGIKKFFGTETAGTRKTVGKAGSQGGKSTVSKGDVVQEQQKALKELARGLARQEEQSKDELFGNLGKAGLVGTGALSTVSSGVNPAAAEEMAPVDKSSDLTGTISLVDEVSVNISRPEVLEGLPTEKAKEKEKEREKDKEKVKPVKLGEILGRRQKAEEKKKEQGTTGGTFLPKSLRDNVKLPKGVVRSTGLGIGGATGYEKVLAKRQQKVETETQYLTQPPGYELDTKTKRLEQTKQDLGFKLKIGSLSAQSTGQKTDSSFSLKTDSFLKEGQQFKQTTKPFTAEITIPKFTPTVKTDVITIPVPNPPPPPPSPDLIRVPRLTLLSFKGPSLRFGRQGLEGPTYLKKLPTTNPFFPKLSIIKGDEKATEQLLKSLTGKKKPKVGLNLGKGITGVKKSVRDKKKAKKGKMKLF